MKIKHVQECQFHLWNEDLGRHSIQSDIIPLDDKFISWLIGGKFTCSPVNSTVEEYDDPDSAFSRKDVLEENEKQGSQLVCIVVNDCYN